MPALTVTEPASICIVLPCTFTCDPVWIETPEESMVTVQPEALSSILPPPSEVRTAET